MAFSLKYRIFDFLDNQDVEDYLSTIHLVAESFALGLDEAELYIRKWYGGAEEWIYDKFYTTTKTIAELYNKDLHTYESSRQFWTEVITELDQKTVELLFLLPEDIWLYGIRGLLQQKKQNYIKVA